MELSIVMPVYQNENIEQPIKEVNEKVRSHFDSEFIIAEDGSTDRTREILLSIKDKYNLTLDLCDTRRGYTKATRALYNQSKGDLIFFMDSDGEHNVDDFWGLYRKYNGYYDMVVGYKTNRKPLSRLIMSRINNFIINSLFNTGLRDTNCGFRLMKNTLKPIISQCDTLTVASNAEITIRAKNDGLIITEVPVGHKEVPSMVFKSSKMLHIAYQSICELKQLKDKLKVK